MLRELNHLVNMMLKKNRKFRCAFLLFCNLIFSKCHANLKTSVSCSVIFFWSDIPFTITLHHTQAVLIVSKHSSISTKIHDFFIDLIVNKDFCSLLKSWESLTSKNREPVLLTLEFFF